MKLHCQFNCCTICLESENDYCYVLIVSKTEIRRNSIVNYVMNSNIIFILNILTKTEIFYFDILGIPSGEYLISL